MVQGGTACPARTISVTEAPGKPSILTLCTFSNTTKDREYHLLSVKPPVSHVSLRSSVGITDGLRYLYIQQDNQIFRPSSATRLLCVKFKQTVSRLWPVLVTFLLSVTKILNGAGKGRKGSLWCDPPWWGRHRAGGCWSHRVCGQEAERGECPFSARALPCAIQDPIHMTVLPTFREGPPSPLNL